MVPAVTCEEYSHQKRLPPLRPKEFDCVPNGGVVPPYSTISSCVRILTYYHSLLRRHLLFAAHSDTEHHKVLLVEFLRWHVGFQQSLDIDPVEV